MIAVGVGLSDGTTEDTDGVGVVDAPIFVGIGVWVPAARDVFGEELGVVVACKEDGVVVDETPGKLTSSVCGLVATYPVATTAPSTTNKIITLMLLDNNCSFHRRVNTAMKLIRPRRHVGGFKSPLLALVNRGIKHARIRCHRVLF